ncbi:hypothetical protein [Clavibacter michiganensis]|uniref:hypothetical protein n=1 Tax=Clavibacter michiganensis TaxID=28447 RepID=UPI0026DAF106|nr:hypothetical protein [Clavibacter michiganensis]MDO4039270.1 hypothetical protein [Clavibacter michiganensis]MDO4063907.1 hypothetical protein [Clavibacter michiganensis]MDO4110234.1 hypothetical protein [Clavibacter michiganensis]MDO4113412.1 hypothetical protein [Clavibacter michiganensis]MDO4116748.1 hypothetical protein [Clavibacter michiganensis]
MSKADELRARAQRAAGRAGSPATPAADEPRQERTASASAPAPKRTPSVRADPIRITADLPPQHYRELIAYAAGIASDLGRAKVAHVQVVRALVAELAESDDLQRRIATRVEQQLDS